MTWSAATRYRRRSKKPEPAPEKHLQEQLASLFKKLGWRVLHVLNMQGTADGFPDLFALHRRQGRSVVAELKRTGEEPTVDQVEWMSDLVLVAIAQGDPRPPVFLWFPEHLDNGSILRVAQSKDWRDEVDITARAGDGQEFAGEWISHQLYKLERDDDPGWIRHKEQVKAKRKAARRRRRDGRTGGAITGRSDASGGARIAWREAG